MRTSFSTKCQTAVLLILLCASLLSAQTDIRREVLGDKVERYYRPKASGQKPWFFQQVENLFNVILPAKDQLPFAISVAFLVGVSQYDNLSPQLPFVKNDLEDMRQFLLNQGGFDTVYVAANKTATPDLVEEYMTNRFRKALDKRDRLLFYYSGHGADLGGTTGYIQLAQAEPDNFARQVLAIKRCEEWSSVIKAGHILFLYDCCASGLAFSAKAGDADAYSQILTTLSGNGSRMVITAGTAEEKTYEVKDLQGRGNGVFTRSFLNAALSSPVDQRQAGLMTINQIFAQTEISVKKFAAIYNKRLTPRRWELQEDQYRGTFVFVNPAAKSLAMPQDYSQALQAQPRGSIVAAYGMVQLISFLAGKVYIDEQNVDEIESGDAKDYPLLAGIPHKVEVRGNSEILSQSVTVNKGKTVQVTFRSQRTTAFVSPVTESRPSVSNPTPRYPLRSERRDNLSEADVKAMLRQNNFYCHEYNWNKEFNNPQGKGLPNEFELQKGDKVVYDGATGLMWQQSGSDETKTYEQARAYVNALNKTRFAGYDGWRLPTLEEAMSLMEPQENSDGLYISSKFDKTQRWIWTADMYTASAAWVVRFFDGDCLHSVVGGSTRVRAVRSGQ